ERWENEQRESACRHRFSLRRSAKQDHERDHSNPRNRYERSFDDFRESESSFDGYLIILDESLKILNYSLPTRAEAPVRSTI
ncbi:hypothetical protein PENTCL1PPCAC_18914, partial [Pristionchus entomophagus]